jgi:putative ABC transport system permease protein
MFAHHVKIIYRNLLRQKSYSAINIAGLAVGMACCLLISLWILNVLGYDKFHQDAERLQMVLIQGENRDNPATPAPLAEALRDAIPRIESVSRFEYSYGGLLSSGDKEFYENSVRAVDPAFLEMFTFPVSSGDPRTALDNPLSMILTKETAEKYFGDEDPVGRILTLNRDRNFTVTAVVENVPRNSTLQFDILIPFETHKIMAKEQTGWEMGWGWYSPQTFVKTAGNRPRNELEPALTALFREQSGEENDAITLLPFTQRVFFFSNIERYIYIFSAVALLILAMACMNFVNLSTARFMNRARETGLRKVVGARRQDIVARFLGETIVLSCTALVIAVILVELLLSSLNSLIGTGLSHDLLVKPSFIVALVGAALVTGLFAGAYPALFLSGFQPIRVLRGHVAAGKTKYTLRRTLVVVQFVCSALVIIGTLAVYKQLAFIRSKDVGYDKEHVVNIPLRGNAVQSYDALKTELRRDNRILGASGVATPMPYFRWTTLLDWDGKDPNTEIQINMNYVDYDFIETMGIEMADGRTFSRKFSTDSTNAFIVNQEMLKVMGPGAGVGSNLTYGEKQGKIIGVMKDFHFRPLQSLIGPLTFALVPEGVHTLSVRIQPGEVASAMEYIRQTWGRLVPAYPFEYRFVDEDFDNAYRETERMANISGIFGIIAVFIAALGLLGLASFAAEQRTREVGIRKALGASTANIVRLLSGEFLILVGIANAVAWPLAYVLIRGWLDNFAYRIDPGWDIFITAGALALAVTALAVSGQAVRAACANPVTSLRHE